MLELSSQKQTIDSNTLSYHKGKEVAAMVNHIEEDLMDKDNNAISHVWKNDPKPTDGIWEQLRVW